MIREKDYFRPVMEALEVGVALVDNASCHLYGISWDRNARHIREEELLTRRGLHRDMYLAQIRAELRARA